MTVTPENSKYASSITTIVCCAAFRMRRMSSKRKQVAGRAVRIGRKKTRGPARSAASTFVPRETASRRRSAARRSAHLRVQSRSGTSRTSARRAARDRPIRRTCSRSGSALRRCRWSAATRPGWTPKCLRRLAADGFLLGIRRNRSGRQFRERSAHGGRAADRIFVEIQAQLICAAFERRMIRDACCSTARARDRGS